MPTDVPHEHDPVPPCPWCGQDRIRELPASADTPDSRIFNCEGCGRTFVVEIVPLPQQLPPNQRN